MKSRAFNGAAWSTAGDWSSQLLSLVIFTILARLLSPEDFGLIALAGIYIAFVQIFVDPGISQALIQREKLEVEHIDTAFWVNVAVSIVLGTLTFLVAPPLAHLLREPSLEGVIRALSVIFPVSALSASQQALLSREFRFKSLGIRKVMATLSGGIVGIGGALSGFGVWSLVAQQLVSALVGLMVLWWATDWRPKFTVSQRHFKDLFSFGLNILVIRFLSFLNVRLDQFLIGYFLGTTNLGYYSLARRIFQVTVNLFANALAQVALPAFSRLQTDKVRLQAAHINAVQYSIFVTLPQFTTIILCAPLLVNIIFGAKWAASTPILQLLSVAGLFYGINYLTTPALLAINRPRVAALLHTTNSILNVTAFLVAVNWGINAVAAAFSIRAIFMQPINLAVLKNAFGLSPSRLLSQLRASIYATLIMATLALCALHVFSAWKLSDYSQLAILLLTCVISYAMAQYMLNRTFFLEFFRMVKSLRN